MKRYLLPIDFDDVRRQTLQRDGRLCYSARFGWGVMSDSGFFAEYRPPVDVGDYYKGEPVKKVRIVQGKFWEIRTLETEVRMVLDEIKFV